MIFSKEIEREMEAQIIAHATGKLELAPEYVSHVIDILERKGKAATNCAYTNLAKDAREMVLSRMYQWLGFSADSVREDDIIAAINTVLTGINPVVADYNCQVDYVELLIGVNAILGHPSQVSASAIMAIDPQFIGNVKRKKQSSTVAA